MLTSRSTGSSDRALSLSTEHLNKEPSLIAIPPPMSNLPYDPPHLSRWQQAPQRLQGHSNSRSGSAVTPRVDSSQYHQSLSKAATLNDQFRALTLYSRNHCDTHRASTIRPGILNTNTYELSDDLRAKEVDLMERYYGGRLRAQRAARIIQRKFREYRMRAQYAQLRSDRRLHNRLVSGLNNCYPEDHRETQHLASMEDLVIDRAYLDWESEAAGSPGAGSIADLTVEAKGSRSSAPSVPTQPPESEEISSHSCSNLTVPKSHHPPLQSSSSLGTGTGSTSGFVSSPGSCSSGSLPTENVSSNASTAKLASENQTQQQHHVLYYVMDRGEDQRVHQQSQTQKLYVAVPVRSDQHHINLSSQQPQLLQQRYLAQSPSPTTAVLVRRSSTGSKSVQAPVWYTLDGKIYTLAYAEQPPTPTTATPVPAASLVVSPSSRQQIVLAPIHREGNSPVLLQIHHNTSATAVPTSSINITPTGSTMTGVATSAAVANAAAAERYRKRLYRVCLNYFNK